MAAQQSGSVTLGSSALSAVVLPVCWPLGTTLPAKGLLPQSRPELFAFLSLNLLKPLNVW